MILLRICKIIQFFIDFNLTWDIEFAVEFFLNELTVTVI